MASVLFLAEAEVKALACAAPMVCGPALSARCRRALAGAVHHGGGDVVAAGQAGGHGGGGDLVGQVQRHVAFGAHRLGLGGW
jgi:hypothetical protein